jgi:hypothetical protein
MRFEFRLYIAAAGPGQVGTTLQANNTNVTNSRFAVELKARDEKLAAQQQQIDELAARLDSMSKQQVQITASPAVIEGAPLWQRAGVGLRIGVPALMIFAAKRRRA